MKKRHLLGILLAAALLVWPLGSAWAGDMAGAVRFVPGDSFAVFGADMDQLGKLPVYQRFAAMLRKEQGPRSDLDKVASAVGFDPLKDVRSLVIAFPKAFLVDDDEVVLIVEAPFKEQSFARHVRNKGLKATKKTSAYGPYWDIEKGDAALAHRGKYLIVGGPKAVEQALQASQGVAPLRRGKILAFLQTVNRSKALFAVAELPPKARQELARQQKELGSVRDVSGSVELPAGGLKLHLLATTLSSQAASDLAALLRQGLDEARTDRDMQQLGFHQPLSQVQVNARGKMVTIDLKLSRAQLDAVARKLTRLF